MLDKVNDEELFVSVLYECVICVGDYLQTAVFAYSVKDIYIYITVGLFVEEETSRFVHTGSKSLRSKRVSYL